MLEHPPVCARLISRAARAAHTPHELNIQIKGMLHGEVQRAQPVQEQGGLEAISALAPTVAAVSLIELGCSRVDASAGVCVTIRHVSKSRKYAFVIQTSTYTASWSLKERQMTARSTSHRWTSESRRLACAAASSQHQRRPQSGKRRQLQDRKI